MLVINSLSHRQRARVRVPWCLAMHDKIAQLTSAVEVIKALESSDELPSSLEERSHRLALACRAAAAIARDRRRAGLPEPKPEPWPASTWEFLAKHARRAQTSG
jgi:hypothetical protein